MARSVDGAKRRAWSERLRRFERCELTVAAFCEAEGVSTPSFYQWRRRLGARGRQTRPGETGMTRQAFVPLQIAAPAPAGGPVEIHLPNGARICLPSTDPQGIAAAIAAAAQAPAADRPNAVRREEHAC